MKKIGKLALAGLLAIAVAGMTLTLRAEDKPPAEKKEGEKKDAAKKDSGPFRGKIVSVDKSAQTITVGKRTFQITSTSKISKDGKPATLDHVKDGEMVGGAFKKSADGKLNVTTLNIGQKPEAAAEKSEKKEKKKE